MRKRRLHPACKRLIGRTTEQRVQPDELSSAPFQFGERRATFRLSGVPTVAQYNDDGASINELWPTELKAATLTPMSVPPDHPRTSVPSRLGMPVCVVPQVSGYSLQLRAEDECFNSREAVLKPVYELKKDLTVKIHRPRHVAYHDQPGLLCLRRLKESLMNSPPFFKDWRRVRRRSTLRPRLAVSHRRLGMRASRLAILRATREISSAHRRQTD